MLFGSASYRFLSLSRFSLLLLAFLSASTILFAQIGSVKGVAKKVGKKVSNYEPRNLKVLTWNLHLLPAIVLNKHQKRRAKAIGELLKDTEYDVIVIQEAFHKRAQKLIWRAIVAQYPFQYGPISGGLFKFSSGVWIVSKLELKEQQMIAYNRCSKGTADCRARKGALFVSVEKDSAEFHIIGTHLQAKKGQKHQEVRNTQLKEIQELLIEKNKESGTPFIVTGDLNIAMSQVQDYQHMLSILDVENGPLSGDYKFTSDHSTNDMYPSETAQGKVIDYVFLNKMGANIVDVKREVKLFRKY